MNTITITPDMNDAQINCIIEEYNAVVSSNYSRLRDMCMDKWTVNIVKKNYGPNKDLVATVAYIKNDYWINIFDKDDNYLPICLVISEHNTKYSRLRIEDIIKAKEFITNDVVLSNSEYINLYTRNDPGCPTAMNQCLDIENSKEEDTYTLVWHDCPEYYTIRSCYKYPIKRAKLIELLDILIEATNPPLLENKDNDTGV